MKHSPRTLLAATAVSLLAAGCGGGSDGTDTLQPADAVRAAVSTTTQQQSSRMNITTTSQVGGVTVDIHMEGLFDYAAKTGHMTMNVPGGAGTIDEILTPTTVYLKIPTQPAYYSVPLKEIVGTSLGSNTDPTAGLQSLLGLTDDVRAVGKEDVRGDETTHYTGTYDLNKAVEKAQGLVKDMMKTQLGSGSTTTVPFDAYVDAKGRIRKMVQKITVKSPKLQGQEVTSTVTTELYDFGVPVHVSAPTNLQDGSKLLDAFKNQLGTSG
jgi:hypothetical protein